MKNNHEDSSTTSPLQTIRALQSNKKLTNVHVKDFERGTFITHLAKPNNNLYILLKGSAKIYKHHENGKRAILHFIQEGEYIGELGLLSVETQTKDVVAQRQCSCLVIPFESNKDVLMNDILFLKSLSTYLAQKLLSRTDRLSEELNYPLIKRFSRFILTTEHENLYEEKHVEVAEYLNVSYRHLLYTLQQLCAKGIVVKEGSNYRILNRKQLMKLADYF
ncbi:transcriptional regulator YeiL [Erysipelothrix sp. HDW6C]|uniref:transcriptional regulator YeiL n=1 Tax=Erysipelothrix sp. HDW6C TaxID=2714930 RepID=UPI00140D08EB|nr:transcriptional regulator YeiL [Erysipelothrix sp. HDW6C]QIK69560.1 transcriptional regulator YeiL [Erysipelothrix sp. HDW6C]